MGNPLYEIEFTADCDKGTINIPSKSITVSTSMGLRTYTVSGTGTFDFKTKELSIDYTVKTPDNNTYEYVLSGDIAI
ncbi:MAG: hypothetical protein H6551_02495 [Chitinophagales bacterium]|nr:hypothetical protein [Chitinophagaceae bacterium]MCB9063991.1 hypothetical protein [Chitinophagales bacterium]